MVHVAHKHQINMAITFNKNKHQLNLVGARREAESCTLIK